MRRAQAVAADSRTSMNDNAIPHAIVDRFRGFLPVVIDVETGGTEAQTDALLQIASVALLMDSSSGKMCRGETLSFHVKPFSGARIDPAALAVNGINPYHPLRPALDEKEALTRIFQPIRRALRETGCTRAVLVGHNAFFDLSFLNVAVKRTKLKRNPFHPFSNFDTVSLAGLAYGQTVLARAVEAAGLPWDERAAHSASYDAEKTADLFCTIVNLWWDLGGWAPRRTQVAGDPV